MCIAVLALGQQGYPLVIASNRDEWLDRSAKPLHWWPDGRILGGQDETAHGAWFAVNRSGRFGLVTNVRPINPDRPPKAAANLSRGELVVSWLESNVDGDRFSKQLRSKADRYLGFNLLFGDWQSKTLFYFSNAVGAKPEALVWNDEASQPLIGLSNASLDTPWPKLQKLKTLTAQSLNNRADQKALTAQLMADLLDSERFEDPAAPEMPGMEALSAINVTAPNFHNSGRDYGRRCSTVLIVGHEGDVTMTEWQANGVTSEYSFTTYRPAADE